MAKSKCVSNSGLNVGNFNVCFTRCCQKQMRLLEFVHASLFFLIVIVTSNWLQVHQRLLWWLFPSQRKFRFCVWDNSDSPRGIKTWRILPNNLHWYLHKYWQTRTSDQCVNCGSLGGKNAYLEELRNESSQILSFMQSDIQCGNGWDISCWAHPQELVANKIGWEINIYHFELVFTIMTYLVDNDRSYTSLSFSSEEIFFCFFLLLNIGSTLPPL